MILAISITIVFIAILIWYLFNINQSDRQNVDIDGNKKLSIVTTTSMIKDVVTNIAKDYVTVKALMGCGVDPHSYKAKPEDLKSLKNADIILYNGLHLEGKMSDVLKSFNKIKPTYPVSDALPDSDIIRDREFSEGVDPHIWFDINSMEKR